MEDPGEVKKAFAGNSSEVFVADIDTGDIAHKEITKPKDGII